MNLFILKNNFSLQKLLLGKKSKKTSVAVKATLLTHTSQTANDIVLPSHHD